MWFFIPNFPNIFPQKKPCRLQWRQRVQSQKGFLAFWNWLCEMRNLTSPLLLRASGCETFPLLNHQATDFHNPLSTVKDKDVHSFIKEHSYFDRVGNSTSFSIIFCWNCFIFNIAIHLTNFPCDLLRIITLIYFVKFPPLIKKNLLHNTQHLFGGRIQFPVKRGWWRMPI